MQALGPTQLPTCTMGAQIGGVVFITHHMNAACTCVVCSAGNFPELSSGISCMVYYKYSVGHKSLTTLCKSQSMRNRWITTICDLIRPRGKSLGGVTLTAAIL